MMKKRIELVLYGLTILIILATLFTACGENRHIKDLTSYVAQLKQQPPPKSDEKKNLFTPITPVQYTASSLRAPFGETTSNVTHGNPQELEANPLLAYALSMLRFVGTVIIGNNIYAYILAPDNKVYQVKIGDEVGDQHGTVINIEENRIQIMERRSVKGQANGQSITTLELKE